MDTALVVATVLTAFGTLALAYATFRMATKTSEMAKASQQAVAENRRMVAEMKASRVAQEQPQVVVDADYSRSPLVEVVVRNIGRGTAKEITFNFSAPMESSLSVDEHSFAVPLNELPYFKEGIDFLAPGAEIICAWDSLISLKPLLRDKDLNNGITVTSACPEQVVCDEL